jgi:hypothetical protein
LTLAGVYGAIAYYHANRESIETEMESDEAEAKQLEFSLSMNPKFANIIGRSCQSQRAEGRIFLDDLPIHQ